MHKIKILYGYSGSFSIKTYHYAIIAIIPIVLLIMLFFSSSFDTKKETPINSIFYQPLLKDTMEWDNVFKEMHTCHIEKLILQWSKYDVVDFMQSDSWLTEILSQAQKHNIKVIIGLYGDNKYFKTLENPTTDVPKYLEYLLKMNTLQAKKVYAIAQNYSAFDGWYVYDEIDDTNFNTTPREEALKNYLQSLASTLNTITKRPLYISGYFSNAMSPLEYTRMFSNITQKNYTVLLQSGIGANLVDNNNSSLYMRTFSEQFQGQFIPIVEGFTMKDSNITAIEFKALEAQIDLLKSSANIHQTSLFSLRYFLDKKLLHNYKTKYCN